MPTSRQARAARRNVKKAQQAGAAKKTIAHLPAKTCPSAALYAAGGRRSELR
jgi:hypothetical protein